MKKQQIATISNRHIHQVDKLYRMFGGLSSELLDYKNLTLYIKIKVSDRWTKFPEETAIQISNSWKEANLELKDALYFNVLIEKSTEKHKFKGTFL